jgi:hypothetical protein
MQLSLIEIFSILFIHWFADFVLQTHWQATNKSKDNRALTAHVATYSLVWCLTIVLFAIVGNHFNGLSAKQLHWSPWLMLFPIITFILHWITDYFTSRLNSKLWAKGDVHNFFVSVGFDQFLHYLQLFITYYILKNI